MQEDDGKQLCARWIHVLEPGTYHTRPNYKTHMRDLVILDAQSQKWFTLSVESVIQKCKSWNKESLYEALSRDQTMLEAAIPRIQALKQSRWLWFAQVDRKTKHKSSRENVLLALKRRMASCDSALFLAKHDIVLPWTFVVNASTEEVEIQEDEEGSWVLVDS